MVKRRDLKTDLELKMSFKSLQSVLLTIIYLEFLGMDSFTLTIFYKWVPVFVRFLKKKIIMALSWIMQSITEFGVFHIYLMTSFLLVL